MAVNQLRATPMGSVPRYRSFHVVGEFQLGMEQFDTGLALVNITDAEKLTSQDGPTGIRLRLDDLFNARLGGARASGQAWSVLRLRTGWRSNANLFKALSMEKKVMFMILSLIILVAAFNLVSMLVMLVTDKQADIAILRTLGADPAQHHGRVHGAGRAGRFVGIGFGVGLRSLLSWQTARHRQLDRTHLPCDLPLADVYYISELPSGSIGTMLAGRR